ncbi:MAG: polysaccharide export protein [Robiginitomaculum sp.]|nr:polysaccharide export protein [Robiginitomaculum sp.]
MKITYFTAISLVFLLVLAGCVEPNPQNQYYSMSAPAPQNRVMPRQNSQSEYKFPQTTEAKRPSLRRNSLDQGQFRAWVESDPIYLLLPGDQLNVFVYSAPELNQTLIVGPDGRVVMPLARPIMAANLTIEQLEQRLSVALSNQLIDPKLELAPVAFGSQRIFVGGEVGQPGIFELPGQIGTLEAIMMAGGFTDMAKTKNVILVRRHPSGSPMLKVIDLKSLLGRGARTDMTPLRRGDVIYVPRSTIGNINIFMQQYIRDALPVTFGVNYNLLPIQ